MDKHFYLRPGDIIKETDEIRICGEWELLSETTLKIYIGKEMPRDDFLYRRRI